MIDKKLCLFPSSEMAKTIADEDALLHKNNNAPSSRRFQRSRPLTDADVGDEADGMDASPAAWPKAA